MLCKLQTTIQKWIIAFIIIQLLLQTLGIPYLAHDTTFTHEGEDWKFSFQPSKVATISSFNQMCLLSWYMIPASLTISTFFLVLHKLWLILPELIKTSWILSYLGETDGWQSLALGLNCSQQILLESQLAFFS